MDRKFLLIDGSSLLYRAFHALPLLATSSGEYTNAVTGFANMLAKLWREVKPTAVAIAFDKGKETFRHAMFAAYKGTRQKTPAELSSQIPMLHDFAVALGVKFIEKANYEADDIIGTLSREAGEQGYQVNIVTGDRDALQLVGKNISVLYNKKGISEMVVYDEPTFTAQYGFAPPVLTDYKGLMGDSSDNIPGVVGIGPKTAAKLLIEYGTLENVLDNASLMKGKLKQVLTEQKEQALISKKLATIERYVPEIVFTSEEFDYAVPDGKALREFCHRYALKNVWQNYSKLFKFGEENLTLALTEAAEGEELSCTWHGAAASDAVAAINAPAVAFIAGYDGKSPSFRLNFIAVGMPSEETIIVPADNTEPEQLRQITSQAEEVYVYGAKQLAELGFTAQENFFDVKLAAYLLKPEIDNYDLSTLLNLFCPHIAVKTSFADSKEQAAWEIRALFKLGSVLKKELHEQNLHGIYLDIERPLAKVLASVELTGMYVNRTKLAAQGEAAAQKVAALEQDIYDLAGEQFKINSPKQLGEILFDRLGLKPLKKTKTGYSTNAEVLEALRREHPIVEKILAYRLWAKLKSTYLDAIAELIDPATGRLHTNLHQTVTATGRLSSSDPNLQNIPVRTEEGRAIRAIFEPGEGYDYILSADYSQIELRVLAHMSGDENFIDAFRHNEDVHARTAAEVFEVPLTEVTADLRRRAKAVNFGIVYGISDYGLSRDLGIPRKEAAEYIERYFAKYPGVKLFLDKLIGEARSQGYVTTMFGRRRYLGGIKSANFNQRSLAERMAMNTPIQGTAADIIKIAMIKTAAALEKHGLNSRLLLQVHDELLLEVTEAEKETVTLLVRGAMESAANLCVPLSVDISVGKNWAEAK